MSVTLHTRSIVLLVALVGVLVGFAVSQVTMAESQRAGTSARPDARMVKQLRDINRKLGATYVDNSVVNLLDDIERSTCAAIQASYTC